MLSSKHRFNLAPHNRFVGKKIHNKYYTIIYQPNSSHLKLAVVVTKKIDPKAVVRNQIKRRLLHTLSSTLDPQTKINLIIFTKPPITSLTYSQLKSTIQPSLKLLQYAHLKKNPPPLN